MRMFNAKALCVTGLLVITSCAETQQAQRQQFRDSAAEPTTQPVQAQIGDFDGNWVGSGSNTRPAMRNRCGNGPLVDLTIQNGAARAVFRITVRRRMDERPRTEVLNLNGTIDDHGRLDLSDFQSDVIGVLSARNGSGDGMWETRGLACHGTFRVRRRP